MYVAARALAPSPSYPPHRQKAAGAATGSFRRLAPTTMGNNEEAEKRRRAEYREKIEARKWLVACRPRPID